MFKGAVTLYYNLLSDWKIFENAWRILTLAIKHFHLFCVELEAKIYFHFWQVRNCSNWWRSSTPPLQSWAPSLGSWIHTDIPDYLKFLAPPQIPNALCLFWIKHIFSNIDLNLFEDVWCSCDIYHHWRWTVVNWGQFFKKHNNKMQDLVYLRKDFF